MPSALFWLGFLIFLVAGGIVVFIVKLLQDKEDYMDYTLVELEGMGKYTSQGYSRGELRQVIPGHDRDGFIIFPRDVDYLRKQKTKDKKEIKEDIIWAYPYQVDFYPRGTLSPDRNIIKVYPPTPEDFPEQLKNTPLGQVKLQEIADKKAHKTAVEVMRSERDVEDELLIETKGKDLVRKYIKDDKALGKDFMRKYIDKETKSTGSGTSFYPPGGGG